MTRIAVISDVHGNRLALEAVLDDIGRASPDVVLNLGDHVSGPLEPAETADILIGLDAPSIAGNHDRVVTGSRGKMGKTDRFTIDRLQSRHLDWLSALPPTRVYEGEVFMAHGTPQSDETYWLEDITASGSVALRPLEVIEKAAEGLDYPVLLCGHTHTQRMIRLQDGRMVLNPGSVGCPAYHDRNPKPHMVGTGAPDARYALIERSNGRWSATMRAVPYDHMAASAQALANGRKDWGAALATGWPQRA